MSTIHRYRPTLYFVLAFAVTWINGFMLAAQSRQGAEKNLLHLLLAYMGPLLAALFMMYVFADKPFRADFRRRIYDLRLIDKRYLPFTLLLLPLAMVAAIGISIVLGQPAEQLRFAEAFKIFDGEVIFSMILLVLVPVLEELGWRGYGVDSLASKYNLFVTSLFFGALWGLWHLPAFFIVGSYQASLWGQNPIFAINFYCRCHPVGVHHELPLLQESAQHRLACPVSRPGQLLVRSVRGQPDQQMHFHADPDRRRRGARAQKPRVLLHREDEPQSPGNHSAAEKATGVESSRQ